MPTLENLKDELFVKLDKNPLLREFFKDMLEERVSNKDWLRNELVQIILRNSATNIDMIESILSKVKDHGLSLFCQMSNALSGNDGDFDGKMTDLLAEINGIAWIIDHNYSEIEKVAETDDKTPDFRANKGNESFLFEVKNLRVPPKILSTVFVQMEARSLIEPEIYKKQFDFDLKLNEKPYEALDVDDQHQIVQFIDKINQALSIQESTARHTYKRRIRGMDIERDFKCSWKPDNRYHSIGHQDNFFSQLGYPSYTKKLFPLIRKTWDAVERSIEQLITHDHNDAYEKFVLLNWQKPPDFRMFEELRSKYEQAVKDIDKIAKVINPKLHILLL